MKLHQLTDDELLKSIRSTCHDARQLVARIIHHLNEIESRKIHVRAACRSMFVFCTTRLGMSEGEAFRRLTVARLAKKYPIVHDYLDEGKIHLSALVMLRKHLTDENHARLIKEAAGKTKRDVKKLIAKEFPRADVAAKVRKLPDTPQKKAAREAEARGEEVPPQSEPLPGSVEPLSEYRYKVEFTADQEFCDALQELIDLERHSNPTGDIGVTLKAALKSRLAEVRKRLRGETDHPRGAPKKATKPGYVVRDEVRKIFKRDGEQCTYVGEDGTRCSARESLQLHHENPRARGGADTAENVRVLCRAHNLLLAHDDFGHDFVEQKIQERREKSKAKAMKKTMSAKSAVAPRLKERAKARTTKELKPLKKSGRSRASSSCSGASSA